MRKLVCFVMVCLMIVTFATGCGLLQKLGLQKNGEEMQPVSSVVMNEADAQRLSDKMPIQLYFANEDGTKLKLEVRYIPVSEGKKSVNNLAGIIVKELIKGPTDSTLKATIPAGTSLRGPVTLNAGVATVDLTGQFITQHPGGKNAEQLTIYSIVNSLTELKEIEKVKFTIDGKVRSDFKGSFKLDNSFPRTISLISVDTTKATVAPSKDSTKKGTTGTTSPSTTTKTGTTTKPGTTAQPGTSKPSASGQQSTTTSLNTTVSDDAAEAVYLEVLN